MKETKAAKKPTTIDQFIATCPKQTRERLRTIRAMVKKEAPEAEEAISYGVAAFKLHGMLIFFAGFKHHVGIYPRPKALADELADYKGGKGTIQFPNDKPLPLPIIKKVIKQRLKENLDKAALKALAVPSKKKTIKKKKDNE